MKKITCDELEGLLRERVLGTLNEDEAHDLQAHVEGCASCRARLRADDAIARTLATMPTIPCPPRLLHAIKAATVERPASARRARRLPSWQVFRRRGAWAAMAAAACVAGVLLGRVSRNDAVPFNNDPGSVEKAGAVVKWSLVYTAQTLQASPARALRHTIVGDLPRTVYSSMSRVPLLKGVLL